MMRGRPLSFACRARVVLVCTLLAAGASSGKAQLAPATEWTLGGLIQRVLTGDPSVTAATERETSAKAKYDRTWMEYLPNFKVGATALLFDGSPTSSFSLYGIEEDGIIAREVHWGSFGSTSASVTMPLWGSKATAWDLADTRKLDVQKTQEKITEKQRDIALKTTGYAVERERALTLTPLYQESFVNLSKLEKIWQDLVKSGEASPSDAIEISNRRAEIELSLTHGKDQVASLGRLLSVWLGGEPMTPSTRVAAPRGDLVWAMDPDQLQTVLIEQSPDLKLLELAVKGSKSKIDALRLRNLPDVEFGASYVTGTSFQKNQSQLINIGISVSIPITQGLRNSREIVDAMRERRAQENDVAAQRREIEALAIDLAYKIRSQSEGLKSSERAIALRQSQLGEMEQKSKEGAAAAKQVLESRQGLIDAKIDHATKLFDFYNLWCQLSVQAGRQRDL